MLYIARDVSDKNVFKFGTYIEFGMLHLEQGEKYGMNVVQSL